MGCGSRGHCWSSSLNLSGCWFLLFSGCFLFREVPRQQPDMRGHLLLSMWRNGCFTVVSAMHPVVCPAVAGGTFKLEGFVFKSVGIAGTGDALGQQGAFGSGAGLSCAAGNDCAVYRFDAPDGAAAGGQPDTGNRTGRGGSVAGTSWKQRPDPEYGGHRGVLVLAAVSLLPL